jgi:hypothetical protein
LLLVAFHNIQDPSQSNVDNLKNERRDARSRFRNKERHILKLKIEEIETNSKIKDIRNLYRDINDFKKGYQLKSNRVKDEKGDLFADSHSIVALRRNCFSQLLNVNGVIDVRQTEIHTEEPTTKSQITRY